MESSLFIAAWRVIPQSGGLGEACLTTFCRTLPQRSASPLQGECRHCNSPPTRIDARCGFPDAGIDRFTDPGYNRRLAHGGGLDRRAVREGRNSHISRKCVHIPRSTFLRFCTAKSLNAPMAKCNRKSQIVDRPRYDTDPCSCFGLTPGSTIFGRGASHLKPSDSRYSTSFGAGGRA